MDKNTKIFVAGHKGMVGSGVVRLLRSQGFNKLLVRSKAELDLCNAPAVEKFFQTEKPEIVIMAAARVGGIKANSTYPADFLYENLSIQNHLIHQSHLHQVKKFCFLGSSCIYPRECPQPIKEEYLLTGPLEPTNEGYAIAKIAGLKMLEFYGKQYGFPGISLMPCNLYGTNDSYDLENSHVLSALVRKMVDAVDARQPQVVIWGSGKPRREFMHVDDAAAAILFFLERLNSTQFLNIGWGEDVTIRQLTELIAAKTGFKGEFKWDISKPDGMPLKCMDVSRMKAAGFVPKISLEEGVVRTIAEYRELKRSGKI